MNEETKTGREMPFEEQESLREKIIDLDEPKMKFYEDLRQKAKGWSGKKGGAIGGKLSEYLFALPDLFILICRLATDKRVPPKKKLLIGAIISYVILPIDIIPDFIPIIGFVDDLVLIVLGLNMLLNEIDKKILIDNWSGEMDILVLLQKITATAERFLDRNILSKIKNWLKK
ncbi:MAG: DUF1232 domain-containing protein [Candidatus Cloacimonadaceae bacterium]|nr:DUF1232 domain-containing protein [Candidatus Cloacimonadaceae bacterium]